MSIDRYNTLDANQDIHDYRKIVNSQIDLAPISGEKLEVYIIRIKIYEKIARDINWNTHVDNPYKIWHQHKNPAGCFMCNDSKFIRVLVQVLECILDQSPDVVFK